MKSWKKVCLVLIPVFLVLVTLIWKNNNVFFVDSNSSGIKELQNIQDDQAFHLLAGNVKTASTRSTAWDNYIPGQPLPELESAGFTIGDFSKQNPGYMNNNKVSESTEYSIGNDIPFTAGIQMNRRLYGDWKEEKIPVAENGGYLECGWCRRNFQTGEMMGLHRSLMCIPSNYYIHTAAEPFDRWNFYPDNDPCKVVYQLPTHKFPDLHIASTSTSSANI